MTALCALFACLTLSVSAFTDADGAPPYQGQMASGAYTRHGAAACPKSMPFGTVLWVPGYGAAVCLDTGEAIVEGFVDVYADEKRGHDRDWALSVWERRVLPVVVIGRGR